MNHAPENQAPENRLANETSPYLLQHRHNPVDWYPWGEEALARARAEERPILLSIGYSSCHWCHVMERESFADARVAQLMNERFVCIKVDREERPDIDEVYMQATLALTGGRGGWPMNVFLTPALEPFFAGTYFPPQPSFGMPSWEHVLLQLGDAWERRRDEVEEQGRALTELLRRELGGTAPDAVGEEAFAAAVAELLDDLDAEEGGFGPAPKFPHTEAIALLLRHHAHTGDADALRAATLSLDGMARGGIHDHLAGGFARYSTDRRWLVPHFEKMLFDNALLARAYLEGFQATGQERYRRVARETLDYLLREMTSPEGGFFSSTDADSEGEEGTFFVWTPAEVEGVLGPEEARRFCAFFDVTPGGNWEGKSILHTPRSLEDVAEDLELDPDVLTRSLAAGRQALLAARQERVPPGLDDKVLTGWNALALAAFAEGARSLGEQRYLDAATRNAKFLLERMVRPDQRLHRSYRAGRARGDAVLEDYAYLADALVDLYEATGARRWLAAATLLAERILVDFAEDEGGAFFHTARSSERLIVRFREGHDGALPNPNAVAARALTRLSFHLDLPDMRRAARAALEAYGQKIQRVPRAFCTSLAVLDLLRRGPVELALVGDPASETFQALWRQVNALHLPNRLLAVGDGSPPAEGHPLPLLADRAPGEAGAALYVCEGYACQAPITDPAEVRGALS